MKTAIIACGPRAVQMGRIVSLLPDFKLTAMSDPHPARREIAFKALPESRFYESTEEMLEKESLDAVLVETPPAQHTKYSLMALEKGLHVLGEIPAVDTYEEAVTLWKAVHAHPELVYMCDATANYGMIARAIAFLKNHDLAGKMVYAEAEYTHGMERTFRPQKNIVEDWRASYSACKYCTHDLGPLLDLMEEGDLYDTVACMGTGRHFPCRWQDHAMVSIYRTRKNAVVRFLASFALYKSGPYHAARVFTDSGMIELYNEKVRLFKPDFSEFCEKPEIVEIPFGHFPMRFALDFPVEKVLAAGGGGHGGADFYALEAFADAILNGKKSPCPIEKGLAMTLPGIFAAESAKEGGVLKKILYPWEEEK
ncbi:MAG: Gfo/Idh/MocA family oxidoreductase [Lentisphaeria bacterium]|nr:Gfo/Idh/MocA family oxidoreductase [Lentisphaeria bacterium]